MEFQIGRRKNSMDWPGTTLLLFGRSFPGISARYKGL